MKLKFGVVCKANLQCSEWIWNAINLLVESEVAELTLIIIDDTQQQYASNFSLYQLYFKYWVLRNSKNLQRINLQSKFSGCESIKVKSFAPEQLDSLKQANLDFILWGDYVKPELSLGKLAKYGLWFFQFGEYDDNPYPLCFNDLYQRRYCSKIFFCSIRNEKSQAIFLLDQAIFKTQPSYIENIDHFCQAIAIMPTKVCKSILLNGWNLTAKKLEKFKIKPTRIPSAIKLLWYFIFSNCIHIFNYFKKFFYLQIWNVGLLNKSFAELLTEPTTKGTLWVRARKGAVFLADPFVLTKENNKIKILAEEFCYKRDRGNICSLQWPDDFDSCSYENKIEGKYHFSYPFIFNHNGKIYCMPECSASRILTIYELDNQCNIIDAKKIITDLAAIDSILFQFNGLWWLFCTNQDDFPNEKLYLFYAEDLFGEYKHHPLNPVKIDIQSVRGAGKIFEFNGDFYRPTQNSSRYYGGSVIINRIDKLTPEQFIETKVTEVVPDRQGKYPDGVHTLQCLGDKIVIDGLKNQFFWFRGLRCHIKMFINNLPNKFKWLR